MKKSLVSVMIGLLMLGVSGNVWAGSVVAADLNCTNSAGCVQTNEISDGAVTEPKIAAGAVTNGKIVDSAVTNAKIADGAVTDAKITGTISASKIEKPANVVVVAKSGGDFTSIQAAIDSINPTAETPYLVKVMPGTYIGNVTMKSYLHLQGSGKNVTTIQSSSTANDVIAIYGLTNVEVSDLSITGGNAGIHSYSSTAIFSRNSISNNIYGIFSDMESSTVRDNLIANNSYGLYISGSSPLIIDNLIKGNGIWGIYCALSESFGYGSAPTIKGNMLSGNANGIQAIWTTTIVENMIQGNSGTAIACPGNSGETFSDNLSIVRNIINGNGGDGIYLAMWTVATISDNIIKANGGTGVVLRNGVSANISGNAIKNNGAYGISDAVNYTDTPTTIYHNEIIDNGGANYSDILINGLPNNISFNIYDDISGGTGSHYNYNVKSDGTPAPTL